MQRLWREKRKKENRAKRMEKLTKCISWPNEWKKENNNKKSINRDKYQMQKHIQYIYKKDNSNNMKIYSFQYNIKMQRVYLERSKCLALAPNMNSYVEPWRFILLHNKCMHMTYRDKTEFTYGCSSVFLFSFASFRFGFVFFGSPRTRATSSYNSRGVGENTYIQKMMGVKCEINKTSKRRRN